MSKNVFYRGSFLALITILGAMLPNIAMADNDFYVSPQLGAAYIHSKAKFEPANMTPLVTKERFKTSMLYNLTFGGKIYDNTFLELDLAYAANHKFNKTATINTLFNDRFRTKIVTASAFANVNYQFRNWNMPIIPYIIAGVGYSSNKVKNISQIGIPNYTIIGKRTSNFAWQVGTGILLPVTKNVDINLSYKFRDLGKFRSTGNYMSGGALVSVEPSPVLKGKLRSSDILLGVAIRF